MLCSGQETAITTTNSRKLSISELGLDENGSINTQAQNKVRLQKFYPWSIKHLLLIDSGRVSISVFRCKPVDGPTMMVVMNSCKPMGGLIRVVVMDCCKPIDSPTRIVVMDNCNPICTWTSQVRLGHKAKLKVMNMGKVLIGLKGVLMKGDKKNMIGQE